MLVWFENERQRPWSSWLPLCNRAPNVIVSISPLSTPCPADKQGVAHRCSGGHEPGHGAALRLPLHHLRRHVRIRHMTPPGRHTPGCKSRAPAWASAARNAAWPPPWRVPRRLGRVPATCVATPLRRPKRGRTSTGHDAPSPGRLRHASPLRRAAAAHWPCRLRQRQGAWVSKVSYNTLPPHRLAQHVRCAIGEGAAATLAARGHPYARGEEPRPA
mmetsp:Transcript_70632/g.188532  ORF Transcript_70632/g.188532 Transcript_70632/m.188532 type:complete len:216 (-) Transcript_70632:61-708(-)